MESYGAIREVIKRVQETEAAMHTARSEMILLKSFEMGMMKEISEMSHEVDQFTDKKDIDTFLHEGMEFWGNTLVEVSRRIYEAERYYQECREELDRVNGERERIINNIRAVQSPKVKY